MPSVATLAAITPRWTANDLWRRAQRAPTFDLDFTRQSIVDRIGGITPTFTRAGSTKLAWDGTQFVSYPADVPAFYFGSDGRFGLLMEPIPATNLFLNAGAPATQSITVEAKPYCLSFYGTGTIALSGVSTAGPLIGIGGEPSRVWLSFISTAGSLTLTLSGTIIRPQLELGTLPSSPIATAGANVTRAPDVLTLPTSFTNPGGDTYSEGYEFGAGYVLTRLTQWPAGAVI